LRSKKVYINIFDFVDAAKTQRNRPIFPSQIDLRKNSVWSDKVFLTSEIKENNVLEMLVSGFVEGRG